MIVETEKICVAMRGRPTEGSDYSGETEQRLEPNNTGTTNTLTSVAKDNLVLERVTEKRKQETGSIKIKQPNSKGYAECKIGGVFDANYATSKTRRGRVQENGELCPTICAENQEICRIENGSPDDYTLVYEDGEYIYYIKIRKLTPRECWRLMDFRDRDFDRAQDVNSNTQLYKQAGNSIVKNVLVAIIGQMFEGCENRYKEGIENE